MPAIFHKRKTPLQWSDWSTKTTDFPDQRTVRSIRKRIVGYFSHDIQSPEFFIDPFPIYEFQENFCATFPQEGRKKPTLQSWVKTYYYYQSMDYNASYFCTECFSYVTQRMCYSCNLKDPKKIYKIQTSLPESFNLTPEYLCIKTGKFPDALKEEIMMKSCHPERKNLWKWILDLEELADIEGLERAALS
jgi:hypothetical protein